MTSEDKTTTHDTIKRKHRRQSNEFVEEFFKDYNFYKSINLDPSQEIYQKAKNILYGVDETRYDVKNENHSDRFNAFELAESRVMSPLQPNRNSYESNKNKYGNNDCIPTVRHSQLYETPIGIIPKNIDNINKLNSEYTTIISNDNKPKVSETEINRLDQYLKEINNPNLLRNNITTDNQPLIKDFYHQQTIIKNHEDMSKIQLSRINDLDLTDIKLMRDSLSSISYKIMKILLEDLTEKYENFAHVFALMNKKDKKTSLTKRRKFLICIDAGDLKKQAGIICNNIEKDLQNEYLFSTIKNIKEFVLTICILFQENLSWFWLKIKLPVNMTKSKYIISIKFKSTSSILPMDKMPLVQNFVDVFLDKFRTLAFSGKQFLLEDNKIDLSNIDNKSCSIWNSGVLAYKVLAKDYIKLSNEKIDRESIYFFLLEKYHRKYSLIQYENNVQEYEQKQRIVIASYL